MSRNTLAATVFLALYGALYLAPAPEAPYQSLAEPSLRLLFGTDLLGRDLAQVIAKALRATLTDVLIAFGIAWGLAVFSVAMAGLPWGWARHTVRSFMAALTAVPPLLAALVFATLFQGSTLGMAAALALLAWPRLFKLLDGEIQALRAEPYYFAAHALGLSPVTIMAHYLAPAAGTVTLRVFPLETMELIAIHATLTFLGVGAMSADRALGRMVATGRYFIDTAPWMFWGPVGALTLVLLILWMASPATEEYYAV